MNKKKILIIFLILVLLVIAAYVVKKHQFDVNKSPADYNLNTMKNKSKYLEFVKKYIEPKKLGNFLNVEYVDFFQVEKYDSGIDSLKWFQYEAYTELFNQMFDKNRKGFDDCPVSEKYKNKFGNNLFEYFKFSNVSDSSIDCGITTKDKILDVTEAGDFNLGEPGYVYYHHFHYVLDDEGNVDDIIFDYTE